MKMMRGKRNGELCSPRDSVEAHTAINGTVIILAAGKLRAINLCLFKAHLSMTGGVAVTQQQILKTTREMHPL